MAISGQWVLHYSWGCTGSYGQVTLTFNNNGTFGGAFAGKWYQQEGTILLSFDSGPAKYGGTVNGGVGSGGMSTFTGSEGCWYLTESGISGVASADSTAGQSLTVSGVAATAGSSSHDAAGNRA
jgi:hypothetical protein